MSSLLSPARMEGAESISLSTILGKASASPVFQSRFADSGQGHSSSPQHQHQGDPGPAGLADEEPAIDPIDHARADAFAQGFDEGMRVASEGMAVDQEVMERLADALAQIAPAAQGALSALLSSAILRLVTQIVGEVEVDPALLARRVEAVAAFIDEEQTRKKLHVHPDDLMLLTGHEIGFDLVPDADLGRGSVRLDTAEGWVEDGPDVQLSRLKAMLDTMEGQA